MPVSVFFDYIIKFFCDELVPKWSNLKFFTTYISFIFKSFLHISIVSKYKKKFSSKIFLSLSFDLLSIQKHQSISFTRMNL